MDSLEGHGNWLKPRLQRCGVNAGVGVGCLGERFCEGLGAVKVGGSGAKLEEFDGLGGCLFGGFWVSLGGENLGFPIMSTANTDAIIFLFGDFDGGVHFL